MKRQLKEKAIAEGKIQTFSTNLGKNKKSLTTKMCWTVHRHIAEKLFAERANTKNKQYTIDSRGDSTCGI